MKLHLPDGKTATIKARNNSDLNRYVETLTVDGKPYDANYITRQMLYTGATLDFTMGSRPNTARGIAPESRPYSFSTSPDAPKTKKSKK